MHHVRLISESKMIIRHTKSPLVLVSAGGKYRYVGDRTALEALAAAQLGRAASP